jgi:hypothetical protein
MRRGREGSISPVFTAVPLTAGRARPVLAASCRGTVVAATSTWQCERIQARHLHYRRERQPKAGVELVRRHGPFGRKGAAMDQRSAAELLEELSKTSRTLVRQEVQLAKVEILESLTEAKRGMLWLIAAAVPGAMAVVVMPLTVAWLINLVLPLWAAGLIISAGTAFVAAAAAMVAWRHLKRTDPLPRQTMESVKEAAEWLRHRKN